MERKTYEAPSIEVTKLEVVRNAKSWNPGKGNVTSGGNGKDNGNKGGKKKH